MKIINSTRLNKTDKSGRYNSPPLRHFRPRKYAKYEQPRTRSRILLAKTRANKKATPRMTQLTNQPTYSNNNKNTTTTTTTTTRCKAHTMHLTTNSRLKE